MQQTAKTLSQLNALTSPLETHQLEALQRALDGLSPTQIAWVSGYLAGLAAASDTAADLAAASTAPALTVLYGSQTGNAKGVAVALSQQAEAKGLATRVISMGEYPARQLAEERLLLVVVSTYGDGEPPESARALYAYLHSKRTPRLERVHYGVLGLGDSSYEHFCRTAREFDARLAALGATRLLPCQCCDVDYAGAADRWVLTAVAKAAELAPRRGGEVVPLPGLRGVPLSQHGKDHPYRAVLIDTRRITSEDAFSHVRHLALELDPKVLPYRPGDALGVWFRNDPRLVEAVLEATGLDGEAPVTVTAGETTLRHTLTERLELTQLHPAVVRAWAAQSGAQALECLTGDEEQLRAYAGQHQVIDLLREHPSQPEAAAFAKLLHPLQPRLYSIASSPAALPGELHLTVCLLRYGTNGAVGTGGCSGFLVERLGEDDALDVYVVENSSFRLPADPAAPVILVGAGTGVAPFRAFLQERTEAGAQGRNWLVFGNRHFHRDFLYHTDWLAWRRSGVLAKVSLAFSREGPERVYVQDRLREEAGELYRWLAEGAHLYVCGATRMGQAVHRTLLEVVVREGVMGEEAAREYVDNLLQEGRYHRDLYL